MRSHAIALATLAAFGAGFRPIAPSSRSAYAVGVSTNRTGARRKHPCGKRRR